MVREVTVSQARELLIRCAAVTASRDDRVRTAYVSGLSKAEIHRLTSIARTTIDRIVSDDPDTAPEGAEMP